MFNPIKSILFATNLSVACKPALVASVYLAAQHKADFILLHVVNSEVPGHVEGYYKRVLGEEKWEILKQKHEQDARNALIGKMSHRAMGQRALRQFCTESGINPRDFEFNWQEIVVASKDLTDTILTQAQENHCSLIVLGSKKGYLSENSIGSKIKKILVKSQIPVMIVPAVGER